jgi:hypothetical protein
MAIAIEKLWRGWSLGRFRIGYIARDGAEVVRESRLSFDAEPDWGTEDTAFAGLLTQIEAQRARDLNRLNQRLGDRFGDKWLEVRPVLLRWISTHPTATAAQAATAFNTAFPASPYDARRLFTALMAAFDPPFGGWAEFRDYVVANITTVEEG